MRYPRALLAMRILLSLVALRIALRAGASSPQIPFLPDVLCFRISQAISPASAVYYPGDTLYEKGLHHYASSSTQRSKCVVEAGTPRDVGVILVVLGQAKTPFAVKGGGHTTNPGFSSTPEVHISMYRFSEITYHASTRTVDVGAGLIWDDVYAALEPFGVNVLGSRVSGIGVAGFTLGGGYSWKTNQYGLAVDNVVAFELVQPNGHVVTVTNSSDAELFFGLKGGMNNFGVVTKFTLKAHPQTEVWGGSIYNLESSLPAIEAATVAFQASVSDPKAALIVAYNYVPSAKQIITTQMLFYDAPVPPPGIFDAFLKIPYISFDVKTRSFLSLIHATPSNSTMGARAVYQGFPILSLTHAVSAIIVNETTFWGQRLADKTEVSLSYDIEMFVPSIYSHDSERTAFPPTRDLFFQPFNMAYTWNSSEFDAVYHEAAMASSKHILRAATVGGQAQLARAPNYPNYAIAGTPLEDMYGENIWALRKLKARIDPLNVMGLAGGWKF